jgi:acetate kinase
MREHHGHFCAPPIPRRQYERRPACALALGLRQSDRMAATHGQVLTLNAGSSSVKVAVYIGDADLTCALKCHLSGTGTRTARFTWTHGADSGKRVVDASAPDAAETLVLGWLEEHGVLASIDGVGRRVVHGFDHTGPVPISPPLLSQLHDAAPYAPEHLPAALRLIEALTARAPGLPQVACFDTAFHHTMPEVARLLPIPRRYQRNGVRRYGFHGLSCEYLLDELTRLAGADAAHGRVLLAHLGNGASVTAVRDGRSLDTSMGFTPAAGLLMGTRTGDLDPGVVLHVTRIEQMTADQFDRMVNHESGLLGVSGISSDMRELLAHERCDERAAAAVALFCYQARKWIGALATVLGGVDTLVFAGGIGERSAVIRARICEGLAFLGIEIDEERNRTHAAVVSRAHVPVAVRIIPTNEELMIARSVVRVLGIA